MKKLFCLTLVVLAPIFSGCMSNGSETIVLPELESSNTKGNVPTSIIPSAIRNELGNSMPIYSGTSPPDISGQYRVSSPKLTGSNQRDDVIGQVGFNDIYIAFIKGSNGKLSYRQKQGSSQSGSDNVTVEIVGSGSNFTAYFEADGESDGIRTKMSTVISGTLTSSGISNFNYAFVMLEKGYDPDEDLVPVNTWRTFKDGDGLAERYNWW